MAAATVDIPAVALSVGPMLNGWHQGQRTGSGTIIWKVRQMLTQGEIDYEGFIAFSRGRGSTQKVAMLYLQAKPFGRQYSERSSASSAGEPSWKERLISSVSSRVSVSRVMIIE